MRKALGLIILLGINLALFAQRNTYIGIENGSTFETNTFIDSNPSIGHPAYFQSEVGFTIGQELTKTVSLEIGIVEKFDASSSIKIKHLNGSLTCGINGYNSLHFPIRLINNINLHNNRLFLNTIIGYNFCLNTDYDKDVQSGLSSGGNQTDTTSIIINTYTLTPSYSTIQAGLGLEYCFKNKMKLSFIASMQKGFKDVQISDYTYYNNSILEGTGKVINKGDYFSLGFKLQYPISNIFSKKQSL